MSNSWQISRALMMHSFMRHELFRAKDIYEEIASYFTDSIEHLKKAQPAHQGDDSNLDEYLRLSDALTHISNIYCVAVSSIVEAWTKRLGKELMPGQKHKLENFKDFDMYREMDLLRRINTCIKHHSHRVCDELMAAYPDLYKNKRKIELTPDEVLKAFNDAEIFLSSIIDYLAKQERLK